MTLEPLHVAVAAITVIDQKGKPDDLIAVSINGWLPARLICCQPRNFIRMNPSVATTMWVVFFIIHSQLFHFYGATRRPVLSVHMKFIDLIVIFDPPRTLKTVVNGVCYIVQVSPSPVFDGHADRTLDLVGDRLTSLESQESFTGLGLLGRQNKRSAFFVADDHLSIFFADNTSLGLKGILHNASMENCSGSGWSSSVSFIPCLSV